MYVVYEENTFGFLFDFMGCPAINPIAAITKNGHGLNWKNGMVLLAPGARLKVADEKDFNEFRVFKPKKGNNPWTI